MIISMMAPINYSQPTFNNFTPSNSDYTATGSIYEIGSTGLSNIEALALHQVGRTPEVYTGINDTFPCKLYLMLSDAEEQGLAHIVSWQPHGRCFVVRNRKQFVKHIMATYFRMTKFESFQRQLNLYGFNRITTGRDKGGYYHESFLRGRGDLCCEIQRHKVKGTRVRKPAALETQPNFYTMPIDPILSAPRKAVSRLSDRHPILTTSSLSYAAPPMNLMASATSSANVHVPAGRTPSSSFLSSTQVDDEPLQQHSLVALSKSATPEAFARMLQNAALFDPTCLGEALQQQELHQQRQLQQERQQTCNTDPLQQRMAKRLSLLWDQVGSSYTDEPIAPEPILLRQLQQQQIQQQQQQHYHHHHQPQQQQQQQIQQHQPFADDLDRSFDALLSVLSRMDATSAST